MFNKLFVFIITKFFKDKIHLLLNVDNLVTVKLDRDVYQRIEKQVGTIRGNNSNDMDYAYMLGQQSVLKVLRDDYTR